MEFGTLREEQAKELIELGKDLSASDKKIICEKMDKTKNFISVYLRGDGKSTDYAYEIIKIAKSLISKRYKQIQTKQTA